MLCVYPSSPSCALGIIAAIFLLAEQIVITVATNCYCCCGVRCSLRCTAITSLVLFVSSWSTFVIAFMGLIYTAILNNTDYLTKAYPGNNGKVCNVGNAALFLGTACWCVISTGLGLISYAFWVCGIGGSNNDSNEVNQEQGVSMGEPHMPPAKEQC
ncbi:uncharacterized protein LOC104888572 [Beta vulgaris subsp. vulgaris]|uniref:uncharacterized protein LOC104888572 n=1 Tax=Beta vulgaris subsp. vulgaris TaxID=3555 RepID=UPI00203765B4|nr:uncharacterized protein LOC104888572 [Beta vulgaris subsp. vulgaris]